MYKEILLTHNDLDGAGCRIVYTIAMNNSGLKKDEEWKVINCANTGEDGIDNNIEKLIDEKVIDKNTIVTIADICPSYEVLIKLRRICNKVEIYDHHITAIYATEMEGIDAKIVPENDLGVPESGTSLIFLEYVKRANEGNDKRYDMFKPDYVHNKLLCSFVDNVRSYDTYEWKSTNNFTARRLNILWTLLKMERFCAFYINRIRDETIMFDDNLIIPWFDPFIDAKIEFAQSMIDNFTLNDCYIIDVKGYKTALVVKATMANVSELANQFLSKHPEIDVFALFSLQDGGVFSFRTNKENINIGTDIAAPIGGGGHPKAAGAAVPKYILNRLYDDLYFWLNGVNPDSYNLQK